MVNFGALAQAVQNNSGLNTRNTGVRIKVQNSMHVFGEIQHNRDIATLARKACAGSAGQNRRAILLACDDAGEHITIITWNHEANGNLTIVGGIRGVQRATATVEADFSLDRFLQLLLELRRRGKRIHRFAMGAERQRSDRLQRCLGA